MRLPTFWNVHILLGALHFFLNPLLSSTATSNGNHGTLWDNSPYEVSPEGDFPESLQFTNKRQKNPSFLAATINITVREGDMATLPCAVKNLGTRQVAWRRLANGQVMTVGTLTWIKDKRVFVDNKIRHEQPGVSDWNLLLKNARQKDSGVYECQITDKKKFSRNITLTVIGPPIRKPGVTIEGKEFPNLGEEIRLTCNATGGPHIPEEIDWFKEGDKIDSHKYPNILITKYRSLRDQSLVSQLIIDHSREEDKGMYICRSSDEEIASLKVTVMVAGSVNKKRVPRPVDPKSQSNQHGARYRTGSGSTYGPHQGSSASGLLLEGSAWIAFFVYTLLYPLCMHVI
ncbi:zwei Ig domain protein zig-8-like [Haliotis rubra]|uniref:zwei Ig domain protein zig-8-like n=1 Tax=Haliotis rubra TaxID=36100 RepID=UPI001EE5B043|nr:zwei Ig domain protein zig-8-like [Haliotis rubra]